MEICLGGLQLNGCIIYLYNIIVFATIPMEYLRQLRAVFKKLKKAGLKLKPSKCELFTTNVVYLGHVVTSKGIETEERKTQAILCWPTPKTVTDVLVS